MSARGITLFEGPPPELAKAASGIGLRAPHTAEILARRPAVGFLEAHSENYFSIGGAPFEQLAACRGIYPVSLHGVGLSLGSAEGVDETHLQKLKALVDAIDPVSVSEHVSWSAAGGRAVPDLLPLPLTFEALDVICANIGRTQDRLGRALLMENPSAYLSPDAEMSEPEFLIQMAARTGCGLLLDLNNIHVSAHNLGFDPGEYLDSIPPGLVGEIHLAGYQDRGAFYIDAHNHAVHDAVWDLYDAALQRFGDVPTLIEWDNDLPALNVLLAEAQQADWHRANARAARHAA